MKAAFKVERRGRKRKLGKRHPSGDLVTQRQVEDARVIAFLQPHRQCVPENVRHDPRAESFFGRLLLNGVINDKQYQAGMLYRRAVQRYRAHFIPDMPDPTPPSIAGFMQPSGGGNGPDESQSERIKDAYDRAVETLMRRSQKVARAVARVAVWDEWPQGMQKSDLYCGLDLLAAHYGLTRA